MHHQLTCISASATVLQELLLRRCVAALLSWHRIAALERKRTSLLADQLWRQHQLRSVRLAFQAWRDAAAVATAQSSFVMQLLSVEDKAMLTGSLRAWRAQCHTQQSVSSLRWGSVQHCYRKQHAEHERTCRQLLNNVM